ncbi:MAG: hypothetical protein PHC34_08605 [Candidatus Gastranaerophilales bacterium]|nr:hypothetical protein [Candidatus Gastranaerophilales bacterium]
MKISSIGHVYMQPQSKALNDKQKDNAKVSTIQQNNFSPALLLSANMNKVSFGKDLNKEGNDCYCAYEEIIPDTKKPNDNQTRKLVECLRDGNDFYDPDCAGASYVKAQAPTQAYGEKPSDRVFKDQVKQLCKSDMNGAENLAKELFEQMYNINPQAAKRVLKNNLKKLHEEDIKDFQEIKEEIDFLCSKPPSEKALSSTNYF